MYEELIEQLRETSIDFGESDHVSVMLIEAADAIEELQKQLREEKVDNVNLTGWLAEEHAKHRWIPVTERLPETDVDVLALYEYENTMCKKWTYICRASYIPKFTVLIEDKWNDCDGGWEDYNEDDDSFYVPEGWYEETSEGNGDGMS